MQDSSKKLVRASATGEEPPPFLGTWKNVYIAVLCYLALLILALYVITRLFTA